MNVNGGYDGAVLRRAHVITLTVATLIASTSGRYIILNPYRVSVIFRNGTTDVYTTEPTVTHFAILLELQVPSYARQRRRPSSYRGYQTLCFREPSPGALAVR